MIKKLYLAHRHINDQVCLSLNSFCQNTSRKEMFYVFFTLMVSEEQQATDDIAARDDTVQLQANE